MKQVLGRLATLFAGEGKRRQWGVGVLLVGVLFLLFYVARGSGEIGTANMELLLRDSKPAKALQVRLDASQTAAQEFAKAEEAKLRAAEARGASMEEMQTLVREEQQAIQAKQQELITLNNTLTRQFREKVRRVCGNIARRYRLKAVVSEQALLWGGRDVTEEILAALDKEGEAKTEVKMQDGGDHKTK